MSFISHLAHKIKHAEKQVEHGVTKGAKVVGKGVTDTASDVAHGASKGAHQISEGATKAGKDIAKGAVDVSKGRSPFKDLKHLAEDVGNAAIGTVTTLGNTVISVGNTSFQVSQHLTELTEKEALVVYRNAKEELTTVINATSEVAQYAEHEVAVGARVLIDGTGKLIATTLNFLEQTLMNELQKLFNGMKHELEQIAKDTEEGVVKGLNAVKDEAAKDIKAVASEAEGDVRKLVIDAKSIADHIKNEVQKDWHKLETGIVKIEDQIVDITKELPNAVKDEMLYLLKKLGNVLGKESLKLAYSMANAYRKEFKKLKDGANDEVIEIIDSIPISVSIGGVGMFYQSFATKVDKMCEILLKYHHSPPPMKRANILEMVELLEPDFAMFDASISASFVVFNVSLAKVDVQAPFIDKKVQRYLLNAALKALGVPAGDMSILKEDDGLADLGDLGDLDDTDLNLDDITVDVDADATVDDTDYTYDPHATPDLSDDADDPALIDLPLPNADDILAEIGDDDDDTE